MKRVVNATNIEKRQQLIALHPIGRLGKAEGLILFHFLVVFD